MSAIPITLPAPSRIQRLTNVLLFTTVCLLAALAARASFLAHPFVNDSGLYIYMGKTVAEGGRIYRDFYETKLPGVPLIMAGLWKMFGAWWGGYVLVQTVMGIGASILLGRSVAPCIRVPVTLFAIVFLNFGPAVFGGFQLETLQVFFEVLAAAAALRMLNDDASKSGALAFTAGVAAGCAALVKPGGVAVALALIAVLLVASFREKKWRGAVLAALVVAGMSVPFLAVFAWVVHAGLLPDMPALLRQCALYARETPIDSGAWGMLGIALVFIAVPLFFRRSANRRHPEEHCDAPAPATSIVSFVVLWFAIELVGILVQRRMYAYYFLVLAPPAALLFGFSSNLLRLRPIAIALAPAIGLSIGWSVRDIAKVWRGVPTLPVAQYLQTHGAPGDAVWADQMSELLIETGMRPGARYAHVFYFTNYDDAPLEYSRQLLKDFADRRPAHIVLRKDLDNQLQRQALGLVMLSERPVRRENFFVAWQEVREYVATRYQPEAEVDGQIIYRLRPDISAASLETIPSR